MCIRDRAYTSSFTVPIWLMVICSLVMGLGTSIGGYRIIKSVGMDMVKLKPYQGFAADLSATLCLLLSSLTGIPVSTTPVSYTHLANAQSCFAEAPDVFPQILKR